MTEEQLEQKLKQMETYAAMYDYHKKIDKVMDFMEKELGEGMKKLFIEFMLRETK